jgi:cytochrome c oxidase assembly protein subunit 11
MFYFAKNLSDEPIVGTATFNVTPAKVGQYFMKIDCFCFVEQLLKPGESMNMPVTFFIDPDIYKDENVKEVNEITLSYTFMKSMDQSLLDGNKL